MGNGRGEVVWNPLVYGTYDGQDLRSRWRSTTLCEDLGRKIEALNGFIVRKYALAMDVSNDFKTSLSSLMVVRVLDRIELL